MKDLFKFKTLSVMHPDVEDRLTYGPDDLKPGEERKNTLKESKKFETKN